MDLTAWEKQLAEARVSVNGPDGLARAVVDGTGLLVELILKPELLRRPPDAVAKLLLATVRKAQNNARNADTGKLGEVNETLRQQIARDVEEARATADRYMAEFNAYVSDLRHERRAAR